MMYFRLRPDDKYLDLVFGKEVIEFDLSSRLDRLAACKKEDEYVHINNFIGYLGESRQKELFEVMKQLHAILDTIAPFEIQQAKLTKACTKLYQVIDEETVDWWVRNVSTIPIPPSLQTEYTAKDKERAMTYLRDDYFGLVQLAVALRFMLPVWAMYVSKFYQILGNMRKEYIAMRLVDKTWVVKGQAGQRLTTYIEAWIRQKNSANIGVIGGISSFDLASYLQANLMIRQIASCEFHKNVETGGLVVGVFLALQSKFDDVKYKMPSIDDKTRFTSPTKGSDETNFSNLEQYKIVQPVRIGDLVIHKYFANQTEALAKQVDETLPLQLLKECIKNAKNSYTFSIQKHAVLLTQWVLQRHIPCRLIYHMNKKEVLNLVALSQALLWHWDFPDLAILMTAQVRNNTLVSGIDNNRVNRRVRNDPMAMLDKLYPYQKESRNQPRNNNLAHKAISELKDELGNCWLVYNAPEFMQSYINDNTTDSRGGLVPDDLIAQLAEMVVYVNQNLNTSVIEQTN